MLWRDEPTPEQVRVRRLLVVLGVLVIVGGFAFAVRRVQNRPAPSEAPRFADLAPFKTFVGDGNGGWVGELAPGWSGLGDPAAIDRVCAGLVERLQPSPQAVIQLMTATGDPVTICR